MFNVLLAVGAGYLLGNPQAREAVTKALNDVTGSVVDMLNKTGDGENASTTNTPSEPKQSE